MKEWMWNNQEWLTPIMTFVRDNKLATFIIVFAIVSIVQMVLTIIGELFDYFSAKRKAKQRR